jgi:hypothetical protein
MTKRRVEARESLEVFVNQGDNITIKTESDSMVDLAAIYPDLMPTMIRWLQECLAEIEADKPPVT